MRTIFGRTRSKVADPVEGALAAWHARNPQVETLSAEVRQRILQGAYEQNSALRLPSTRFRPVSRGMIASMLPAILAFAVVALFPDRTGDGARPGAKVLVGRAGDEVVFSIANGSRGHSVLKSNSSSDFRNAERISVRNGTFRDRVHDDADLVFYRID